MWLWDANIVRAYSDQAADGHDRVLALMRRVGRHQIGLLVVVASELVDGRLTYLHGAYRLAPSKLVIAFRHLHSTLELISTFAIVPFDEGSLAAFTTRHLFPGTMGRGDRLIAAIALAGNHTLVTRNVSHFNRVPNLQIENWIDLEP